MIIKLHIKDFVYGLGLFVPATLLIVFAPIFDFGGVVMQGVCIGYALVISCMISKAISNYIQDKNQHLLLVMIGSLLFCFSDIMLLFHVFSEYLPLLTEILCMSTYYPAQCLLAYAIYHSTKVAK